MSEEKQFVDGLICRLPILFTNRETETVGGM